MEKKALFFDIDGTLLSEKDRQVPHSAVLALKKARENGHLVFINTGRTYCQTKGIRAMVETDGLLCGCGTYIVAEDCVLYNRVVPETERSEIKDCIDEFNLEGILEGVNGCSIKKSPTRFPLVERLRRSLEAEGTALGLDYEEDKLEFSKFCALADEASDVEGFCKALDTFQVIDRGGGFYECVPKGHSKATAIEFILNRYQIPKKDAWVFGDSTNDLSMFEYADNAVLMEVHDAALEPFATFITRTVEEDGIAYALERLGFI